MAAGVRLLSRRRGDTNPYGIPEAQLSDKEHDRAAAVFEALQDNATEAPATG
jgi:hypothetical protein